MRKILILITVTIAGLYTLKAQRPDIVLEANAGFGFNTPQGFLHLIPTKEVDRTLACTRHKTALDYTTNLDAHSFDKPIYTSQIGSLCGQDFYLYASGIEAIKIATNGNVGIGTDHPMERLSVNGKICAKEVKVTLSGWPDFVFSPNYQLLSLPATEAYIKTNGHLPDIPTATEVEKQGIQLGEINALLLKKIEEMTLHIIELEKRISELEKEKGSE
jgi:hypothetical protein